MINKKTGSFEFTKHNGRFYLRHGTKLVKIDNVKIEDTLVEFSINNSWYKVLVKDEKLLLLDKLGFKIGANKSEGNLISPMPGKILDILVQEGDSVKQGQPLIILEAMKMENELKASVDGIIKKLEVTKGQSVEKKTQILEIETIG